VEVNWPDVSTLDRSMIGDIEKDDAGDEEATLYLGKRQVGYSAVSVAVSRCSIQTLGSS
jgi:hypothetical protein